MMEMEKKKIDGFLPWLMLPYPISPSDLTTRQFFLLSSSTTRNIHLPELDSRDYHGLNRSGWILVVSSGVKSPPFLFNPTTGSHIPLPLLPPPSFWNQHLTSRGYPSRNLHHLPPPKTLDYGNHKFLGPDHYMPRIHRAAISSSDPENDASGFEIIIVHGWDSKLSFYRRGDPRWSTVVLTRRNEDDSTEIRKLNILRTPYLSRFVPCTMFRCLAHCSSSGLFYAVDANDCLVVCDTRASPPTATALLPLPLHPDETHRTVFFLAAAASEEDREREELLLVIRRMRGFDEERDEKARLAGEFQVFKLAEAVEGEEGSEKKKVEWVRVDAIGERAIFVCQENAFVISTVGVDDGCSPNRIYYSDQLQVKHPHRRSEKRAVIIEYNILENKYERIVHSSPPSPLCLWRTLWFQPSDS